MLSAFRCHAGCYSSIGAQLLGFVPLQPVGAYLWQAYVQPGDGHQPTPCIYRLDAPSTILSGGSLMLLNLLFPLLSLHGGEGSFLGGLVPSDDMVNSESVVGIELGDSGVVIGYKINEFTHTRSAEQFIAHSHIFLGSLVRCHH